VTEHTRNSWALILGASSGFGAAAARALAQSGFHIIGVHLDRRSTVSNAENLAEEIRQMGRRALFFNFNAADAEKRAEIIRTCREEIIQSSESQAISLMLHSLAFGTLKPYIATEPSGAIKSADLNMTLDVMAHSLVYWTQDLLSAGLLAKGAKIFAMTSAGGHRVWPNYGAVSAAKAALEAHVRQLAVELAPFNISVNALQAGVTDTPAARRIPGSTQLFEYALKSNPGRRLTTPEDVALLLSSLSQCKSNWMTGNVMRVDGGEDLI
jgi:enoyl-[acyl-carrier protein] reductase III